MCRWLIIFFISYNYAFCQEKEVDFIPAYQDSLLNSSNNHQLYYDKIGQIYFKENVSDSAKKYFKLALATENDPDKPSMHAYISNDLGKLYYTTGMMDSSLHYYRTAKHLFITENKLSEAAHCEINLGVIYKDLGQYEKALDNLLKAARTLEQVGKSRALGSCYNTIAMIYSRQNDLQTALLYYKEALRIRQALNLEKMVASSLNNIGIIFRNLAIYDSAIHYYQQSLEIKEKYDDVKGAGATLNNIGMVLMDQQKYDQALTILLRSLDNRNEADDKSGLAITLNNLGLLYFHKDNPHTSLSYLNQASEYIEKLGLLEELKNNLEIKINVYEQLGQNAEALALAKKLLVVKDSLLSQEKVQTLISMEAKYDTEKKVREISLLEQQQKLQQAELHINQMWLRFSAVCIILLAIIGVLLISLWRKEKTSKQKVQTLMQELHHRVKNNLQLLSSLFSLQSRVITDKSALEAVKSGENRVNAMAIIHQKLYKTTKSRAINLKEYLTDLIKELAEAYGYDPEGENISINIDHSEIDVSKIIPVGLIVNELVSNSFKYAFPSVKNPTLVVEVIRNDDSLSLKVEDNGTGFVNEKRSENSMGLNIIESLSRQLKGSVKWSTVGQVKFNLQLSLT